MYWFVELYWTIGASFIVGALILHYSIVLPFLQGKGQIGIGSWLFNFQHGKDLELYGKFCLQEGRSFFWCNALKLVHKLLLGWILGWAIFMLILSLTE